MSAGTIMMRSELDFVMTAVTELCPLLAINRPSTTAGERQLTGSYQGHQRKTQSSQMGREWTIRHPTTTGDYIALRQVGIRHLELLLENSTVDPRGEVYRQREVMYLGYTFRKTTDVRKVWTQEVSNHAV